MKHSINTDQKSLFSVGVWTVELPADNELIKMGKEIPWEEMVEVASKAYSSKMGRNSCSIRMMLGLEIAKRRLGVSDEEIVSQLRTDAAMKWFCGFDSWQHEIPDASSMTYFRKRMTPEILEELERVSIRTFIRKAPRRNRHQVITDSTCVPANISYPSDTGILTGAVRKLEGILEETRKVGADVIIRGKQKIKKLVRGFQLKRKKTQEEYAVMNKKLLQMGKGLIKQVEKRLGAFKNRMKKTTKKKCEEVHGVVKKVLEQQEQMIKTKVKRVAHRIVSLHEPNIRPIFRGKAKAGTEFGKKLSINVVGGGLVQSTRLEYENYSDTEMPEDALQRHRKTFNRNPSELIGDRGAHSPGNHEKLKSLHITDGLQYRGTVPKKAVIPKRSIQQRMYRTRSVVEAKIGILKTKYGLSRCPYKSEHTQGLISFAMIAMNATWCAAR